MYNFRLSFVLKKMYVLHIRNEWSLIHLQKYCQSLSFKLPNCFAFITHHLKNKTFEKLIRKLSNGLAFPRDVPGQTVVPFFVLSQRNFLVPVFLCPRTRTGAKIPGQTPLSRDKMNFYLSNCTVLERHFPVLERPFLF